MPNMRHSYAVLLTDLLSDQRAYSVFLYVSKGKAYPDLRRDEKINGKVRVERSLCYYRVNLDDLYLEEILFFNPNMYVSRPSLLIYSNK